MGYKVFSWRNPSVAESQSIMTPCFISKSCPCSLKKGKGHALWLNLRRAFNIEWESVSLYLWHPSYPISNYLSKVTIVKVYRKNWFFYCCFVLGLRSSDNRFNAQQVLKVNRAKIKIHGRKCFCLIPLSFYWCSQTWGFICYSAQHQSLNEGY